MTSQIITGYPTTPVIELTELMTTHQISCVVIVETFYNGEELVQRPVGIITERDIVHFQAIGLDVQKTQIAYFREVYRQDLTSFLGYYC